MMKKLILGSVVTAALVFTGCGSDDDTTTPMGDTTNPVVSATATAAIDTTIVLATDNTAVTEITLSGADAAGFTTSGIVVTTPATAGEYTVTVVAKDAAGNTTTQDVVVTVTDSSAGAGDPTERTATTPYIGSDIVTLGGQKWIKIMGDDGATDLMDANNTVIYSYGKTWAQAKDICDNLSYLDGGGWHMPDATEAVKVLDGFTKGNVIDSTLDESNEAYAYEFTGTLNSTVYDASSNASTHGFWISNQTDGTVALYTNPPIMNQKVSQNWGVTCTK